MKNCPNCGLEMDDKARFCSLCGFAFTNQRAQNSFNTPDERGNINEQRFDPTDNTQTFSATDDTIYFNSPNEQNRYVPPHEAEGHSYGRSEDTSARPPMPHNINNMDNRHMQDQPQNTANNRPHGQPYGNTPDPGQRQHYNNNGDQRRYGAAYDNNNGFDNYGYDEEEQPHNRHSSGIETDKPGKSNALVILSAAAVFAAIVLVVVIFALASGGNKNKNDGETSKTTGQTQTEAVTEAPEGSEEETEKPTEKETEATKAVTKERVKAEKIAERICYIDSDSDELYSYKSEYVLNDMDKKTEKELWNGMELSARSTCHSHKKNWYECWSLDSGDYVGWVDEKLLTFGQKEKPEEPTQPEQSDPIAVDGNNILHVDFDIAGYDYWSIQQYLGISLGEQIDFPFWGINDLKYSVGDYKGNKLCFVFKYDKLVSVVYETKGKIDQDMLGNASNVYGGYNTIEEGRRYGFNANRGCLYIIEQDNMGYNTDGQNQDVVHQKIMLSELYQNNNNNNQQQGNQWGQDWGHQWNQFWNW